MVKNNKTLNKALKLLVISDASLIKTPQTFSKRLKLYDKKMKRFKTYIHIYINAPA